MWKIKAWCKCNILAWIGDQLADTKYSRNNTFSFWLARCNKRYITEWYRSRNILYKWLGRSVWTYAKFVVDTKASRKLGCEKDKEIWMAWINNQRSHKRNMQKTWLCPFWQKTIKSTLTGEILWRDLDFQCRATVYWINLLIYLKMFSLWKLIKEVFLERMKLYSHMYLGYLVTMKCFILHTT